LYISTSSGESFQIVPRRKMDREWPRSFMRLTSWVVELYYIDLCIISLFHFEGNRLLSDSNQHRRHYISIESIYLPYISIRREFDLFSQPTVKRKTFHLKPWARWIKEETVYSLTIYIFIISNCSQEKKTISNFWWVHVCTVQLMMMQFITRLVAQAKHNGCGPLVL
jgi:hypothetical protein